MVNVHESIIDILSGIRLGIKGVSVDRSVFTSELFRLIPGINNSSWPRDIRQA
jgi:hypothetical protein